MSDDNKTIDLTALSPEEREAWELEQKATPIPLRWENTPGVGLQIMGTMPNTFTFGEGVIPKGKEVNIFGMPETIRVYSNGESLIAYERWVRFEPEEWNQMQEANAELLVAARNLLPALLSKVARLTRELAQWPKWGVVEVAIRNPQVAEYCEHWEKRTEAAESRISDLTKEKDSALQERDRYKQELYRGNK